MKISRRRCRRLPVLFVWFAAGTLAPVPPPVSATVVVQVDTVIYSERDRPLETWTLPSAPTLSLGGADSDGAPLFWRIAGLVRLDDESVAVADWTDMQIRLFSSSGQLLRAFGGEGDGPGEFPSLWDLWRVGDLLIGTDGLGNAHAFSTAGKYVATTPPAIAENGTRMRIVGHLSDGTPIGQFTERPPSVSGQVTVRAGLVRMDRRPEVVARLPGYVSVSTVEGRVNYLVLGPRLVVAVLHNGFCAGYGDKYQFICYDELGAAQTVVMRPAARPREVTGADRRAYFSAINSANPGSRGAVTRQRVRDGTEFSAHFAVFGRFLASTANELWVGPLHPEAEARVIMNPSSPTATRWSVYSDKGVWLSDLVLPPRFTLRAAGRDYVAGVSTGTDGVERVEVYPILGRGT